MCAVALHHVLLISPLNKTFWLGSLRATSLTITVVYSERWKAGCQSRTCLAALLRVALGTLYPSTSSSPDFAPVSSEEIGFALTMFVQAANRSIPASLMPNGPLSAEREEVCGLLFSMLCADIDRSSVPAQPRSPGETTLYAAFQSLYSFYEGDPHQVAVCARVLAFYFLMERSAGEVVADWTESHPQTPGLISLHPAVVNAIGTVNLHYSVALSATTFRELVSEIAATDGNASDEVTSAAVLH